MRSSRPIALTAAAVLATALAVAVAWSPGPGTNAPATTVPSRARVPRRAAPRRAPRAVSTTTRPDGGGATHTIPATIPSDCSTDVTAGLRAWFAAVPDHVTVVFPPGACYRIEGTLTLNRRHRLVLEGNGATLRATTAGRGDRLQVRARAQLSILNSTDVVVRALVVRGANPHAGTGADAYVPAYEAQHAFNLVADDGVTLDHVQAYDVYGDFVYIGGANGTPSEHVTVEHSRFARSGRQGISVTDGEHVEIVGNTITDVARSLVDLEPNTPAGRARDIRIDRNTTGAVRNYWLADKGVGGGVGDVVVTDNVMRAPSGALVIVVGPKSPRRGPFTFTGNTFETTAAVSDEGARGAFLFVDVHGVTIRDNRVTVPPESGLAAVELRATDDTLFRDNALAGVREPVRADAASSWSG